MDDETVVRLLDAVGSNVRELARSSAAGRRYRRSCRRRCTALSQRQSRGEGLRHRRQGGSRRRGGAAAEALRWAMMRGAAVVLADALAGAVHTIGRVGLQSE